MSDIYDESNSDGDAWDPYKGWEEEENDSMSNNSGDDGDWDWNCKVGVMKLNYYVL